MDAKSRFSKFKKPKVQARKIISLKNSKISPDPEESSDYSSFEEPDVVLSDNIASPVKSSIRDIISKRLGL